MAEPIPMRGESDDWQLAIPDRGQLQHDAEWAQKFRGGTTNLGLRARHNQDRLAYVKELQDEQVAQERRLLQRSKVAQDLWIRSQQLEISKANAEAAMQERAVRVQHAIEMQPVKRQLTEAQLQLARTRDMVAANAEMRQMEREKRALEDTDGLDAHVHSLRTQGFLPGSPEYFAGVEEGLRKHPWAPGAMHTDLRNAAKLSAEHLPVTVRETTDTQTASDPAYPTVTTHRTVTERKQSPAVLDATTPQSGSEFLNSLGIKPKQ